jgi:glycosyltransferase involved in cell wall biosynthesis
MSGKIRYVLVGPVYPFRGGIAHYTTKLAHALLKQCSKLHVVSFRRQYPRWLYPGASDRDPSQIPLQVNAEYLLDPLYPWTWWQTAQRIIDWNPDVIIFQWWSTFWAPAFAALAILLRRRGKIILFVIHNVMPHEPRPWDRWLAHLALRQGHYFLVQTNREQERLLSLLPHAQTTIAPHPIYDMFSSQRIPSVEAKLRLGLPADEPVVLFFGIVRAYKGLRFALEALKELKVRGMVLHLLVAGEFWEDVKAYTRLIERLGLSAQVNIDNRYIPNEQVGLYFSAADVFLAPYIGGTQSGSVKVALSFGLPVVISWSIASAELESDATHRLYWVTSKDVNALADAIERCLRENLQAVGPVPHSKGGEDWDELVDKIEAMIEVPL